MNRGKELAKNTVLIAIGKFSTQFISFFLLPLYTSILSTEEYGIVDLLNTYVQLLLPIVTLLIEQGAFRYLIDNLEKKENKKKIITSSFAMIIFMCFISSLVFILFSNILNVEYKYYIISILIITSFSNWTLQIARGFRMLGIYTLGSFITTVATIIFNIIFLVFMKQGASGMLQATFLGNLCCFCFLFICLKVYKFINIFYFDKKTLVDMLKYSLPLIPNQLSLWIINSSDRTIVSYFLNTGANGLLAISHKFSTIYQSIFSMFQLSWHEVGTVHFNDPDRDEFFTHTFSLVFKFFSSICLVMISLLPFVFPIMVNAKFFEAYNTIPIYLLAVLCNIVVGLLGIVYVASKNTIEIAKSTVYSGIINIIVHILLIRFLGLYAAAISTLISYFCIMIYRMKDTKKYISIQYDYKIYLIVLLCFCVMLIPYYISNIIIRIFGVIFSVSIALLFNKDILVSIFKELKIILRKN